MANSFSKQILADGWRNAVVKIDGILDTSNAVLEPAVALQDFVNNDSMMGKLVGLRVDHVWHSIGDGLEVQIKWEFGPASGGDQSIMAIAGRGRESFFMDGGLQPQMKLPGYIGNIHLYTTGFGTSGSQSIQNFTILLEMVKLYG